MQTIPRFRRDFPPELITQLAESFNLNILLEHEYGSDLGYSKDKYKSEHICFTERKKVFSNSDIIVSLTSPSAEDFLYMKKDSTVISMLHYETHPVRNELIKQLGISAISLDSIVNYEGRRLVEDMENTAWNAMTEAYTQLYKKMGKQWWFNPDREPITVLLFGFGQMGKHAAAAALKMGRTSLLEEIINKNGNTIVYIVPMTSIHTKNNLYPKIILSESLFTGGKPHFVIDATKRNDFTKPIITRDTIASLPKECVVVDLAADMYDGSKSVVKGIEGLPTGSEEQCVFEPNDKAWENNNEIPREYQLPLDYRRTVVSHYAWPSYGNIKNRRRSVHKYAIQIYPIIASLINDPHHSLNVGKELWNLEESIAYARLENFKV